ncbi:hypothetical protein C8Q74DRAFT_486630 [Fomes fomentarius]|nr:hypothetical protein C8Q74DRAFT_486630 [Fomes fomentarius]
MDPSTVIAAGPSNIPPPIISPHLGQRNPEAQKKKRPKRKRLASEASTSVNGEHAEAAADGETESVIVETEVWSAPWVESMGVTSYESKEQRLHDEIVAFFNYISPTPDECHARAMVVAKITDVVRRRFNYLKASVDIFGSFAQNLYLPDGDTDLVISTPYPLDDETRKRTLFQLASAMRNTCVTPHVQVIPRARVPVASFQTMPELGSLKIDISVNATDGMTAVPILRDWFDKLPALRFLVLCIKSLLSRYDLNNASSSGLSSYGVILLAINFLQINPMGRPMALLEQPMENEALGVLLMDFLNYYGNKFRYADSVVSVTQGKLLSKKEKGWENPKFPGALCIECMLKPENDVGRPTSKIGKIRQLFSDAHVALRAYAFSNSVIAYNILGTVLGVSESTLAHRILLKEIVTSGRLTQALAQVEQLSATLHQPYPRYNNSRPYNGNDRAPRGLPPRPPPPSRQQPSSAHHSLPPRPAQRTPYVPQGPSMRELKEKAQAAAADANANGDGKSHDQGGKGNGDAKNANPSSSMGSSADPPQGMRSPPRRRRKAA